MKSFDLNDTAYISSVDESAIVTNGLRLFWDAANKKCYPGTGTVVKDLSGRGINGTFTSPIWSSSNGGVFVFNTANYIIGSGLGLSTSKFTVMGGSRYTAGSHGRVISTNTGNWLLGHWLNTTLSFYSEGWVTSAGAGPNDTNWRIYTGLGGGGSLYSFYVNGVLNAGPNANGSGGPADISLGRSGPYAESSNAEVGFILAYERILTLTEIQQNFNVMRGRYSI